MASGWITRAGTCAARRAEARESAISPRGGGINERAFSSGTLQRTQAARFLCGENSSPSAKNRTRRQKRYITPRRARAGARVTDPRRVSRDRAISTRPDDRSRDPVARAKPRRVVSGADAARVHRLAKKIVRRRALVRVPRGFSKSPEPAVTKGVRRTRKPLLASFQPERANPRSGAKRADREKISFRSASHSVNPEPSIEGLKGGLLVLTDRKYLSKEKGDRLAMKLVGDKRALTPVPAVLCRPCQRKE